MSGRPTVCVIDLSAIGHNYRELKLLARQNQIIAMVKANAYGHGARRVAHFLEAEGCAWFAVATVEEALDLRDSKLLGHLLCLAGAQDAPIELFSKHAITPVLFDLNAVQKFCKMSASLKEPLPVHLEIDTGMSRLGILPEELSFALKLISKTPLLKLEGVFSHFSRADESGETPHQEHPQTQFQKSFFEKLTRVFQDLPSSQKPLLHLANSAGILGGMTEHTEISRPGIALYGSYPNSRFQKIANLKPALSFKTKILTLKQLPIGTPVSYGARFVTARPSSIAVLPVGYADGFPRRLSNQVNPIEQPRVLIRGRSFPVVGRVCMDLIMVDVTDLPEAVAGDEVVLIGSQGEESIFAEEWAEKTQTISYEIFCGISNRVPRLYL